MHTTPFIFGFTTALLAVLIGWGYRHMSARHRCPECDAATTKVTLPRMGRHTVGAWLQKRWCGHCGWEGLSRLGPEFDPQRGPASHESGFHWNRDDTQGPGFIWGSTADDPGRRSDRPSGFEWASKEVGAEEDSNAAHPSGFAWNDPKASPYPTDRVGFEWGSKGTSTSAPKGGFLSRAPRTPRIPVEKAPIRMERFQPLING